MHGDFQHSCLGQESWIYSANHHLPFPCGHTVTELECDSVDVSPGGHDILRLLWTWQIDNCSCCRCLFISTTSSLLHPQLGPFISYVSAEAFLPENILKMMPISHLIWTISLDCNFNKKTNAFGLLFSTFIAIERRQTAVFPFALNLQKSLKNCLANVRLWKPHELLNTGPQISRTMNKDLPGQAVVITVTFQASQRLSGQYIGEHGQFYQRQSILTSQKWIFLLISYTSQIKDFNKVYFTPDPCHNPSQGNLKVFAPQKDWNETLCRSRKVQPQPPLQEKSPIQWSVPVCWLICTLKTSPALTPLPSLIGSLLPRYSTHCRAVGP